MLNAAQFVPRGPSQRWDRRGAGGRRCTVLIRVFELLLLIINSLAGCMCTYFFLSRTVIYESGSGTCTQHFINLYSAGL